MSMIGSLVYLARESFAALAQPWHAPASELWLAEDRLVQKEAEEEVAEPAEVRLPDEFQCECRRGPQCSHRLDILQELQDLIDARRDECGRHRA